MTKSVSTSIHSETYEGFDPQEYHLVHVADTRSPSDTERISANVKQLHQKGYSQGPGNQNKCGHCGVYMRYHALLSHDKSREYIFVGEECLGNRFSLTKEQFADLRRRSRGKAQGKEVVIDTRTATEREADRQRRADRHQQYVNENMMRMVNQYPILAYLMYKEADAFLPTEMQADARLFRRSPQNMRPVIRRRLASFLTKAMEKQAQEDNPSSPPQKSITLTNNQRVTLTGTIHTLKDNNKVILTDLTVDTVPVEGDFRAHIRLNRNVSEYTVGEKLTATVTVQYGKFPRTIFGNYPEIHPDV